MIILFSVVLMDLVGFGLILPILPLYADLLGGEPFYIGALLSVYSLMQFLINPIWGRLSDKIGRRPVILLSLSGSVISYLIYGFADRLPLPEAGVLTILFVSRLMAGVMGANIATAQAYVADITTREKRAQGMGLIGAGIGLGFVLGPALGALFTTEVIREQFGLGFVGFVAAGICLGNLFWAWFSLPESNTLENRELAKSSKKSSRINILRHQPLLFILILSAFLVTLSFSQFEATFALFSRHRLSLEPSQIGLIFSYLGVIVVFMQGVMTRYLVRALGEQKVILTGAVVMGVGLFGVTLSQDVVMLLLPLGLLAIGFAMLQPSILALISQYSAPHTQGLVLGMGQSISSIGRILGPLLAMQLFDHVSMTSPYQMAATYMVIVFLFGFLLRVHGKKHQTN